MWNAAFLQRALVPFAFIVTLMIVLHARIPELRTPVASGLLAVTALLLVARPITRETRRNSHFRTRVILIGNRPPAQKLLDEIEANPKRGYTIVGLVEETSTLQRRFCPYLVLGAIDELNTIVQAVRPDRVVLALSDRRGKMPAAQLLEFQLDGIIVEDVEDTYERFSGKLAIEAVTPGQLISSQRLRKSPALKATQRVLSLAAALVGLVILAPVLGLIALAIKIDTGGEILFRQTRLGKGMRPFRLIKFRTMQPVEWAPSEWCQDNLSRITRVGRWLRRFRLDELPQLVNVIRGDMNLVGPRPHPASNVQLFRDAIPYYVARCSVLPGITGWAQVRYCYANNLEQETEKMRYDLYYIMHMSLWMDLHVMFSTCCLFVSSFLSTRSEPRSDANIVFKPQRTFIPAPMHAERSARGHARPMVLYASDSETHSVEAP